MEGETILNIPKINSINYGGKWICCGLLFAAVIPGIIWLIFHVFLWWLCAIGIVILVAFLIVFHISICTGETVAGFKNYDDSHFTEVMLIRNADDEEKFKAIYGLDEIKKEY